MQVVQIKMCQLFYSYSDLIGFPFICLITLTIKIQINIK
jgi:hypothetical protein